MRRYHHPLICMEYMARPNDSTFDPNLKCMHDEKVGAYNWGFVSGKTQPIYPWNSRSKTYPAERSIWFHDLLRPDGSPYDIKSLTLPVH